MNDAPPTPKELDFDPRWLGVSIGKADWHFHRQLFARYHVVLAPGQFSKIIADIRIGRARLIKAKRKGGGIYAFRINGAGGRVYILVVNSRPRTVWPLKHARRLRKRPFSTTTKSPCEPVIEQS